jgi:hypothetical protein
MWKTLGFPLLTVSVALTGTFSVALTGASGQPPVKVPPKEVPKPVHKEDPAVEVRPVTTVMTLKLRPVKPTIPVLKYDLKTAPIDQKPGNAALLYHRAMIMMLEDRATPQQKHERQLKVEAVMELPWRDAKPELLAEYAALYNGSYKELAAASECNSCDWGIAGRIDQDGIGVLLPEVQRMREMAFYLKVRIRLNLVNNKIEECLKDLRIGFTMAKHVGEGATLIQHLVGIAIGSIMIGEFDRVLEHPGCPNFYWQLTNLPRPFIGLQSSMDGEMRMNEAVVPMPKEFDKGIMTVDQANAGVDQIFKLLRGLNGPGGDAEMSPAAARMVAAGIVTMKYPSAKKSLIEGGRSEKDVAAMPPAQVVVLDSISRYRNKREQYFAFMFAPYAEAMAGFAIVESEMKAMKRNGPTDPLDILVHLLMPALQKIYYASTRTERRIAQMRVVEAVRLQILADGGKVPESLEEVKVVPVPVDIAYSKNFVYKKTATGFSVYSPPPPGEQPNMGNNYRYDITMVK